MAYNIILLKVLLGKDLFKFKNLLNYYRKINKYICKLLKNVKLEYLHWNIYLVVVEAQDSFINLLLLKFYL